jgi:hypothetical protein
MSRRAGGDPVLLIEVAAVALAGGMLAVGALTVFAGVQGGSVIGLPVVIALLSVLVVAFLPVPERPRDIGSARLAAPPPERDDRVPAAPPRPPRAPGSDQETPWWQLTASQSGAGGSSRIAASGGSGRIAASGGSGRIAASGPAAHQPQWADASPADSAYPAGPASAAGHAAPAADPEPPPVSVAVPVPGSPWWEAASAGPAGTTSSPGAGSAGAPQPATSGWDERGAAAAGSVDEPPDPAVTRVVQCPRCGDFGVDVRQRAPGFAFACTRCGHPWRWEPGAAWPTTVVRPRRKRQQAPAGPNRPDSGR